MSTRFHTQRTSAGDIQTKDTTNIQNIDPRKIGRPDDQDRQAMLIQSKMKHST